MTEECGKKGARGVKGGRGMWEEGETGVTHFVFQKLGKLKITPEISLKSI